MGWVGLPCEAGLPDGRERVWPTCRQSAIFRVSAFFIPLTTVVGIVLVYYLFIGLFTAEHLLLV